MILSACGQSNPSAGSDSGGEPADAGSACAPNPACSAVGTYCQDPTTVVMCTVDANGCYVDTPTACASDERCTGSAPAAACGCVNAAPCTTSGPTCTTSNQLVMCTADANGCLSVTASSTCSDQQACAGNPGAAACSCNPTDGPDASHGVFVYGATGDDISGLGTAASPYATIGKGIAAAIATNVPNIYVGPGHYLESDTISDSPLGVSIQGGWTVTNGIWGQDCSALPRANTVLQGGAVAVKVNGVVHSSGFAHMTVQAVASGATPANTDGASTIGILINGNASVFSLNDVVVVAANSGGGGFASAGFTGSSSSNGGGLYNCGSGANGTTPAVGASATKQGVFGATGFTPADGVAGATGSVGAPGTAGGAGICVQLYYETGGCGFEGGGASGQACGSKGMCGAGGGGGSPGTQGRGGGASIAVLVDGTSATLAITNSSLRSGNGGAGSAGGAGGTGGFWGYGGAGTQSCGESTTCGASGTCSCGFACTDTYFACDSSYLCGAGGATGGLGGLGGNGSAGGGGAGGPSYAMVTLGGAIATVDTATTLTFGAGGAGAGSAPAGTAAALHAGP